MKTRHFYTALQFIFLASLSFFFITACSNSGPGIEKNKVCKTKYDPLDADADKEYSGKTQLKPNEKFSPGVVEFVYDGVELYYHNAERDIRLHLRQYTDTRGNTKMNIVCASGDGISSSMEPLTGSFEFVSDFKKATDSSEVEIKTKVFHFDLRRRNSGQRWLQYRVEDGQDEYSSTRPPEDLFFPPQFDTAEQYFLTLKKRPTHYQSLTRLSVTDRTRDDHKKNLLEIRTLVEMRKP